MSNTFVIEKHRHSPFMRLFLLAICGPFFLFGLYACAATIVAGMLWVFGVPIEGHIMYGVMFGVGFTSLGAMGLWLVFEPHDTLTFNRATRRATLVRLYDFGRMRTQVYGFDQITLPQAVWTKDTEMMNGGFGP